LQVDAVVSYDADAFGRSPVPKLTAEQALLLLEGEAQAL
jgi:hypothetical protein